MSISLAAWRSSAQRDIDREKILKADQCYLLLAYLILNHKKNSTVDTLAEIICPYDELDSPSA